MEWLVILSIGAITGSVSCAEVLPTHQAEDWPGKYDSTQAKENDQYGSSFVPSKISYNDVKNRGPVPFPTVRDPNQDTDSHHGIENISSLHEDYSTNPKFEANYGEKTDDKIDLDALSISTGYHPYKINVNGLVKEQNQDKNPHDSQNNSPPTRHNEEDWFGKDHLTHAKEDNHYGSNSVPGKISYNDVKNRGPVPFSTVRDQNQDTNIHHGIENSSLHEGYSTNQKFEADVGERTKDKINLNALSVSPVYRPYEVSAKGLTREQNQVTSHHVDGELDEVANHKFVSPHRDTEVSDIIEKEDLIDPDGLVPDWNLSDPNWNHGDTQQHGSRGQLSGNILNMMGGLISSVDPEALLLNGMNKKFSQVDSVRKSVLDFRDRALDQRVGTKQQNEINQFDPRFQESLTKNVDTHRIPWNSLKDLIPYFQSHPEADSKTIVSDDKNVSSLKNILGKLGGVTGAVIPSSNTNKIVRQEDDKRSSNQEGRRTGGADGVGEGKQFLSNARKFVTNPVGFVKKKVKDKIKKELKDGVTETVGEVAGRVRDFKGKFGELTHGLKESLTPEDVSSDKHHRNCLKIYSDLHSNTLYVNDKKVSDAHIVHIDKDYPSDLHSHPVDHQDEILKDCLMKGSILLLCQPDLVKVQEEHGRQLEMIIAKDVVKDRMNGFVDTLFQRFGKQILKGFHLLRRDNDQ